MTVISAASRWLLSIPLPLVLAAAACGSRQTPQPETDPQPAVSAEAPHLNDVQLECRSTNNLDIADADRAFGPGCNGPTLPLSLGWFDMGTSAGMTEAIAWDYSQTWLCICTKIKCPDDVAIDVMARAKRVMVDEAGKREREGVTQALNSLASHSCLRAPVAAEIFKLGFQCAFAAGLRSPLVERERMKTYLAVYQGDQVKADKLALECLADSRSKSQ